jgi:hypothetical protein
VNRRITITVADDVTDLIALDYVRLVVAHGRVSYGNTYCFATTFPDGVVVAAHRTRTGSDAFHVYSRIRARAEEGGE